LSIAAAFIIGTGDLLVLTAAAFLFPRVAALFALAGDRFFLLAVFGLGLVAVVRLLPEGLLARFFEACFSFLEAFLGAFFFFLAILICSLFVRSA
jgi:hypothetical protein